MSRLSTFCVQILLHSPLSTEKQNSVKEIFGWSLVHLCFSHQYFAPSSIIKYSLMHIFSYVFRRENRMKSCWRWSRDPKKHETKSQNFLGGETFSEVRSMEYNQKGNTILKLFWFTASLNKIGKELMLFKVLWAFWRGKIKHTKAI